MEQPPDGVSEGGLMAGVLRRMRVPETVIGVEQESGSTFDNFIKSIESGLLVPGQFDLDNPLALSASGSHSWRSVIIARQALAVPDDTKDGPSLFRLRGGDLENGWRMGLQERVGCALTRLALLEVDAEPGNLEHTREASKWFNEHAQNPWKTLLKVGRHLGRLASMPQVPEVTSYATTA